MAHNDIEEDRVGGSSPLTSLSPATSASPMPNLSFTPLSAVESDFKLNMNLANGDDSPMRKVDKMLNDTLLKDQNSNSAAARASAAALTAISTNGQQDPSRKEYEEPVPQSAHSGRQSNIDSPLSPRSRLDSLRSQLDFGFKPSSLPSSPTILQVQAKNDSAASGTAAHPSASAKEGDEFPVLVKPKPILRTASTKSVSLRHPAPDITLPSSAKATNIAQLEATAERLSTATSSTEDAIRDLHDELKRNDSRRSSILAASIASIPENTEPDLIPFPRQLSTAASSIVETNTAARSGGYSPAAFILSPTHSLRSNATRLRSGSNPDSESQYSQFSRHGPGKSSTRSVRSTTKPTLGDIAELPPTALTSAAMDAADQLGPDPRVDIPRPLRIGHVPDDDKTPNQDYYGLPQATPPLDYWDQAVVDTQHADIHRRPSHAGSTNTYDQAELAFADFDGTHCSPDANNFEDVPFMSQQLPGTVPEPSYVAWDPELSAPQSFEHGLFQPPMPVQQQQQQQRRSVGRMPPRPQSYMDPESGNHMLFYPAPVPMMLNLPQKLSKKPNAETRNKRRSEMFGTAPPAPHAPHKRSQSSMSWLPEIQPQSSFEDSTTDAHDILGTPQPDVQQPAEPITPPKADHQRNLSKPDTIRLPAKLAKEDARKSRMSVLDTDKRQSQMPTAALADSMPPQLRASAFFDLPAQTPSIQLKDGSAVATLDSILDASAKAPVSAFTDHVFAGSVGTEVWGLDQQKRKSHAKTSSQATLQPKKRSSFLHLRNTSGISNKLQKEDRRNTIMAISPSTPSVKSHEDGSDDERQALADDLPGSGHGSHKGDGESEGEGEEEGELMYTGPPTTLLAELQIRKQQNKMRTRPITQAHPNGMHSTLLELDTVAQIQNRSRKAKINLAWEETGGNAETVSDDEDMPLALLLQTRNQGDEFFTAMADLNRPVGLIEQRDMEENEPLSRRRNRLQGREALPMHIARKSVMSLGASGLRMNPSALGPPSPRFRPDTPEEEEDEHPGETLRERMQRLRAQEEAENPLPKARPVSSSFSAELLGQWGEKPKEEEKPKSATPEEEETLGQRRRRLQAEREARDQELGQTSTKPPLRQRHSMADVLGSHPASRIVLTDPRANNDRRRQEEAAAFQQQQEQKMAAFRNQMPTNISTPNLQQRAGGYMSGQFNDGAAGQYRPTPQSRNTMAFPPNMAMPYGNMYGAPAAVPYGPASAAGLPYSGQLQTGQMDMVERWRQSVMP